MKQRRKPQRTQLPWHFAHFDEQTGIVGQVAMRENHAFWKARRAAGVLDLCRIVRIDLGQSARRICEHLRRVCHVDDLAQGR